MKNWFMNLEPRERKMVIAALSLSVIAILYLGFWVPVDKAQKRAANDVELWQRSVDTIRSLKGRIGSDSGVAVDAASLNQPIVVIIDASLRARGLDAPKRSQPTGENIRVEFDAVAFDDMMLWLGCLLYTSPSPRGA